MSNKMVIKMMTRIKKIAVKMACVVSVSMFLFPFVSSVHANDMDTETLKNLLEENPEIMIDFLYENSEELVDIIQHGVDSRRDSLLLAQWEQGSMVEKSFIQEGRPILGNTDAPISIFGFTNFTCSYCGMGAQTITDIMQKYPNDVKFVFKAIPNSDTGRYASRWFIAATFYDEEKAWQLHDAIFQNQQAYASDPINTMAMLAGSVGLNAVALEKYVYDNLQSIDAIIDEDILEAKKFGVGGTPHFFVQGDTMKGALSLPGALPLSTFEKAIDFVRSK